MAYQVKELLFIFVVIFILQLICLVIFNLVTRSRLLKNIRMILITSYLVVIINLTLWPPLINQPAISWSEVSYNLKPFDSILGSLNHFYYVVPLRNIIGNIVLLLPLALFFKIRGWKKVFICGFFISLSIEVAQVIMTKTGTIFPRSFDVDDLILNTFGFYIGYVLRYGVTPMINRIKSNESESYSRGQ